MYSFSGSLTGAIPSDIRSGSLHVHLPACAIANLQPPRSPFAALLYPCNSQYAPMRTMFIVAPYFERNDEAGEGYIETY